MTMCVGVRLCQCCSHLHLLEKGMNSLDSGMEDIGLEGAMAALASFESNPGQYVKAVPTSFSTTLILCRLIYQLSSLLQLSAPK